jgi:hypothetical protein
MRWLRAFIHQHLPSGEECPFCGEAFFSPGEAEVRRLFGEHLSRVHNRFRSAA